MMRRRFVIGICSTKNRNSFGRSGINDRLQYLREIVMAKIEVMEKEISVHTWDEEDYICITDIAKYKSSDRTDDLIRNWLRNRNTIDFLGIWEHLNNPDFNPVEFDGFRKQAGLNSFTLTPSQWIERTNAIGMISKRGRYGGTYAHKDIAFEFASWISVEFKLYLIKEFQRLKENERKQLGWDIKRNLAKINYRITYRRYQVESDPTGTRQRTDQPYYASEADVLNVALFGMTAKEWREKRRNSKGNIRDEANVAQLVCLSNLENLNAHFINEGMPQAERVTKLNQIAIQQMKLLIDDSVSEETRRGKIIGTEDLDR